MISWTLITIFFLTYEYIDYNLFCYKINNKIESILRNNETTQRKQAFLEQLLQTLSVNNNNRDKKIDIMIAKIEENLKKISEDNERREYSIY